MSLRTFDDENLDIATHNANASTFHGTVNPSFVSSSQDLRYQDENDNAQKKRQNGINGSNTITVFPAENQLQLASDKDQDDSSGNRNLQLGWKRYLGLVYSLISTNMFSLGSILVKLISIDSLTLGTYAFPTAGLVAASFVCYAVIIEKKNVMVNILPFRENKKAMFFIWFRATTSVILIYTFVAAFRYISVADTRTILAASVITVNFFGWLCLGEKCGVIPVLVPCVALLGIGVMTRPPILTGADAFDNNTLIGVSLAVFAMILATLIILSLRMLQNTHHGVLNTHLYAWATILTLPFALYFDKVQIPDNRWHILGMIGVGVLWTLGNTFLVLSLQVEEAGVVALIRTSEVIFTYFWQTVILGKYPDLISLLGAALVLTGVITVTLRKWVDSLEKESTLRKRLQFLLM